MIFSETRSAGAYTVDIDRRKDDRGYAARIFCADKFSAHGLRSMVAQASVSFNAKRGTLRGLHFQYPPAAETKYVRCTRGAVFDVIVDLRPEAPTYLEHLVVVLSTENARSGWPKTFRARLYHARGRHRVDLPHQGIPYAKCRGRPSI